MSSMEISNKFNSKVLLFGEYGIIKGSKGLAIPFKPFGGELVFGNSSKKKSLVDFFTYLKRSPILKKELDLVRLESDINAGLDFTSNIPQGFGLGSSGALCAAIFSEYSVIYRRNQEFDSNTLSYIQEIMSIMESCFHGTSSGIDPLISYLDRPLMIENDDKVQWLFSRSCKST